MQASPVLELVDVHKDYPGAVVTRVLHEITITVDGGEFTAIVGPSGSGKSTLLNVMGLLDRATSGTVRVGGEDTTDLDEAGRTRLRSRTLGFVFQFHHLITSLSAAENVMMPLSIQRGRTDPRDLRRAEELLAEVGLGDRAKDRIAILSGGQQQRVAIARALAHDPKLVLADEPTGNLDTQHSDEAFDLMRRFNRERGTAFLVVTHDPRLAARCDRIIEIVDGRIAGDGPPSRRSGE